MRQHGRLGLGLNGGVAVADPPTLHPPRTNGRPPRVKSATRVERFKVSIGSLEPLAVGADEAAHLCGIGRTLWAELDSAGKIPAPVKLGNRCVWAVAQLRAWMQAGCPDRERWEILKKQG